MLLYNDWKLMDTVASGARDPSSSAAYGTTFNLNVVFDNRRVVPRLRGVSADEDVTCLMYLLCFVWNIDTF